MRLLFAAFGVAGFLAGELVTRFFPDCHEVICWPGVSPFFLMLFAGVVGASVRAGWATPSQPQRRRARLAVLVGPVVAGAMAGAFTGIFVSLGAGVVMVLEARPYCCGPKSFWSPIVLTACLGTVVGLVGSGLHWLVRRIRLFVFS